MQRSLANSPASITARLPAQRRHAQPTVCKAANATPISNAMFNADSLKRAGAAALLSLTLVAGSPAGPALAELNRFEFNAGGEFGIGTAQQYGEADLKKRDFSNQDLTRSNFTAADCRECNFSDTKLTAAYFIKSVLAKANFTNADLSDALMDRAVIVDADLSGAILERVVLTRSDLSRSTVQGADFSNALIDRDQQMALCKYADGVNPTTGVETRKSLGCGSKRRFKASSPSSPEGPQVSDEEQAAYKRSLPGYQQ